MFKETITFLTSYIKNFYFNLYHGLDKPENIILVMSTFLTCGFIIFLYKKVNELFDGKEYWYEKSQYYRELLEELKAEEVFYKLN